MITNSQLFTILKKSAIVVNVYDKEMDKLAQQNNNEYDLSDNIQLTLANKAFNTVLGESTVNVNYEECSVIFDLIHRI